MEATRLNATKGSPMMVAIERCLDQVDAKILEELAPKICNLVRKGIGLPTKAGTSRIICSLATRCPTDVTPHAPALLKALSGVVQDRSAVLRKATSAAAGHVARLVPDSTVVQYIQHVTKFYLESEDDDLKHITPIALMELARYAPDKVKSVMSEVLPVTFIGIHDPAKDLKTQWTAVWDELAAGSTSACRLWIIEIMALCERLLKDSQSWPIKRQVAKSLATLAQSSGNTFDDHRAKTFSILLESLGGWTWDGKEDILESLGQLSIESKKWLMEQSDKTLQNEIIRVAIRESKKTNKNYRRIAIECLGKIAYELEQDVFSDVLEYFTGVVQPKDAEDEMDVDDDEPRDKPLVLVIQANTYKAIGRCFAKPLRLQGISLIELGIFSC